MPKQVETSITINTELPFSVESSDIDLIRQDCPVLAEIILRLKSDSISPDNANTLRFLVKDSILFGISVDDLSLQHLEKLLNLGLIPETKAKNLRTFLQLVKNIREVSVEFEILKEKEDFKILISQSKEEDKQYYSEKHQLRLQHIQEKYDDAKSLSEILVSIDRFYFSDAKERSQKAADEKLAVRLKLDEFFKDSKQALDITGENADGQLYDATRKNFTSEPPLVSLLTHETRAQLSSPLRTFLVTQFDNRYRGKFFSENGGLLIDYTDDLSYLMSLGLDEKSYQELLGHFIREVAKYIEKETPDPHIKVTRGTGVFPGYLTNPFQGTHHIEHMIADDQLVTEIGLFLDSDSSGSFTSKDLGLVISGAWEFMFQEGLYQSPDMEYTLSPRKVLPFLKKNLEILKKLLTPEQKQLISKLELTTD